MYDSKRCSISETRLIILMGLVQFIDILEFMIIMPLGPDFAAKLDLDNSLLGRTSMSYAISAAISGIISAIYIDMFERKKVLVFSLIGLIFAIFLGSTSNSLNQILMARFIAGAFGGVVSAVNMAIIIDLVPIERRGRVIGKVMSAFSFAAALGVPFALEISRWFGWKMALVSVGIIGTVVLLLVILMLPGSDSQKSTEPQDISYKSLFSSRNYILGFVFSGLGLMASFMMIPYISAYLQLNLEFPRKYIGVLYALGGAMSFVTVQFIGKVVDQRGSYYVLNLSNVLMVFSLFFGFIYYVEFIPIIVLYCPFMVAMAMRNVATSALVSKIPKSHERGGYMSLISMFQNLLSASGSYVSSIILLQETSLSPLQNIPIIASIALVIFLIVPFIAEYLEKKLIKDIVS